jgi:hypothetical protein
MMAITTSNSISVKPLSLVETSFLEPVRIFLSLPPWRFVVDDFMLVLLRLNSRFHNEKRIVFTNRLIARENNQFSICEMRDRERHGPGGGPSASIPTPKLIQDGNEGLRPGALAANSGRGACRPVYMPDRNDLAFHPIHSESRKR